MTILSCELILFLLRCHSSIPGSYLKEPVYLTRRRAKVLVVLQITRVL